MLQKILSGGQTGVDRAALDSAIDNGFPYGGWCPKGRLDELGTIPQKYSHLKEVLGEFKNDKENYDVRTKLNIKDSDGTLILVPILPLPLTIKDGTLLTIQEVQNQIKPFLIIDLSKPTKQNSQLIINWIDREKITVLNIAGPRESSSPSIYALSKKLLDEIFHYYLRF